MRIELRTAGGTREVVVHGGTLLGAVRRAGLPLGQSCRGAGVCAACWVWVVEGSEHVSPPQPPETETRRLACRTRVVRHVESTKMADRVVCVAAVGWGGVDPTSYDP